MKRTALVTGVLLAAVVFVPGAVSAHGYDDYESKHDSGRYAQTAGWHDNGGYDQSSGTIVDALVADGNFTTLVTAVQAAGLAETLSAPGDLTVFAPTDQAFANLSEGTVEALLANPAALTEILKNHVVAGRVDGDVAIWYGEAQSLAGNTLNIGYGDDGELYIEDSRISVTDIHTENGIVHVIDAVLVPKH